MPYRHAHLVLLLVLAPLVVTAFWRDYFGVLPAASFAFHLHGATATAWLILVGLQSWSIHSRRVTLHRRAGQALFAVVPLFVMGATFVFHSMAVKQVAGHPFYATFGARLGLHDIVSTIALVMMVSLALRHRQRVGLHAGYMLATALLVFPPVFERLPLPLPRGINLGELLPMAVALGLAARHRRDAQPMLVVAGVLALQILLVHTVGISGMWSRSFAATAAVPMAWVVAAALIFAAATMLALRTGWRRSARRAA